MRQKAALSSPVSNVAAPPTPRNNHNNEDTESTRSRRRTERLSCHQPESSGAGAPNRRSVDSASRLASSKAAPPPPPPPPPARRRTSHRTSSSISSENFSDPTLASVSPRKPKAFLTSRAPSLTLQTSQSPSKTRDQEGGGGSGAGGNGTSSPSTTTNTTTTTTTTTTAAITNNTIATNNTVAPPDAPPNITTPSPSASQQSNVAGLDPKSPSSSSCYKRSPASRSSHGIETSSGPPPALSTQRSLAQEKARKPAAADPQNSNNNDNNNNSSNNSPSPSGRNMAGESGRKARLSSSPSFDANMKSEAADTPVPGRKQRSSLPARTSLLSRGKDKMSPTLPRFQGSLRTVSDRTEREESGADTGSKEISGEETTKKNDDVFLNIAKDTSHNHHRNLSYRADLQKTSADTRELPTRLQTSKDSSMAPRSEYNIDKNTSSHQAEPPSVSHGSSTVRSPSSAHFHDETSRLRYFGVNPRSSMGHTRSRLSRANADIPPDTSQNHTEGHGSVQEVGQSRPYRHSSVLGATRSGRRLSGLDGGDRSRFEADKSRHDGTESTLSTNAPSTVWDELDDIKSRIKKLELTGKFPTSSAAAMSTISGERPRTATTTVTTLSSSPKHARKASSPPLEGDGSHAASQSQNLLLTALAKAKPRLSPPVYKSLETTATDALALSGTLSLNAQHDSGASSHVNGNVSSDRQTKWKAEGLCRSLTELCLALSEGQGTPTSTQRPGSRDTSIVRHAGGAETESAEPNNYSYGRSASHEPEDLHHRSHGSGNFAAANGLRESRRSSMHNLSGGNHGSDDVPDSPATFQLPTPPTRLSRTSMLLRNRRLQPEGEYDDRQSTTTRPLSRAMTETGLSGRDRFSSRDRFAHHHSSPLTTNVEDQQPTHDQGQGQPGVPLRRNYGLPSANLPAAPHSTIQPGFRRYAVSNAGTRASMDRTSNERMSDVANPPHEDFQARGAASTRSATHQNSMQQLRSRTNSISGRRIGIRPRQLAVGSNSSGMGHDGVD